MALSYDEQKIWRDYLTHHQREPEHVGEYTVRIWTRTERGIIAKIFGFKLFVSAKAGVQR